MNIRPKNALFLAALTGMAFCLCITLPAADYESTHRVKAGDIISADMINELFDGIEDARKTITIDNILGTWNGTGYGISAGVPGWEVIITNKAYRLPNVTLTFAEITNDYYQVQTTAPNPFDKSSSSAVATRIHVAEGVLWGLNSPCTPYVMNMISKDRLRLTTHSSDSRWTRLITLDRQDVPPNKPKLLSANVSNKDVVLKWQDNSDDEDGFNILRRDTLSGSYSNISSVVTNVTSITNTVSLSGFYWYRIAATNTYGSSLGSNVKRVVVP